MPVEEILDLDERPLSDLTDDELRYLIGQKADTIQEIEAQLEYDREDGGWRGDAWRIRARDARQHHVRQVRELKTELKRRNAPQQSERRALAVEQTRLKASRILEGLAHLESGKPSFTEDAILAAVVKIEVEKARAHAELSQARHFAAAAKEKLPKAQFDALWAVAREMFPDSPAWSQSA